MIDNDIQVNEKLWQMERQMDPFWWVFCFVVLFLAIIFSFSLIIIPIILLIMFKSYWLLLLFVLIPLGIWMYKKLVSVLKKLVWKNTHLSLATIEDGAFTYIEWNERTKQKKEGTVGLDRIQYIVISNYLMEYYYAYARAKFREQVARAAIFPIIYVVVSNTIEKEVIRIPFSDNDSINKWLKYFQKLSIPIYYTLRVLDKKDDIEIMRQFEQEDILLPYKGEGNWILEADDLYKEWQEKTEEKV